LQQSLTKEIGKTTARGNITLDEIAAKDVVTDETEVGKMMKEC
jgi:hypothetical protein